MHYGAAWLHKRSASQRRNGFQHFPNKTLTYLNFWAWQRTAASNRQLEYSEVICKKLGRNSKTTKPEKPAARVRSSLGTGLALTYRDQMACSDRPIWPHFGATRLNRELEKESHCWCAVDVLLKTFWFILFALKYKTKRDLHVLPHKVKSRESPGSAS